MMLPSYEGNRYANLGLAILKALTKNQLENGTIYDRIDKSNTPDNHYAHTFFALASLLSSRYQNICSQKAEKALEYFIHIPAKKKGHHEFNILACLLILKILRQQGAQKTGKLYPHHSFCFNLLNNYVTKTAFEARENTSHGNNWVAIQALILMLRYHQFKEIADFHRSNRLMDSYVLKWQLQDGIFYDAPRSSNSEYVETPLTYHAKFCMIVSLYAQISNRCDIYRAVIRGLDAHSKLVSPNGEGFYFGRTNNAIFGYVSALYAYETMINYLLSSKETDESITHRLQTYRQTADALFAYLTAMQERDGSLRLTPGSSCLYKAGWDSYMHHTVYNSYASAILLMTPHAEVLKKNNPANEKVSIQFLENSGFLAVKHKRSFLVVNVKGQEVDSRYVGMVPLIWQVEGKDLLPSPPCEENLKIRFTPVVIYRGTRYVPAKWWNTHIVNNKYGLTLFAEGVLNELSKLRLIKDLIPKPYTLAFNLLKKTGLTKTVKFSLTQRRNLVSDGLPFKKNLNQLFIIDTLKKSTKIRNLKMIPPSVLFSSANICNFDFQNGTPIIHLRNVDLDVKFKILSPPINHFYQTSHLDTSKGYATLITPQEVLLQDFEETFHSVALLQAIKKGQEPNYKIASEKDTITIFEDSTELLSLNNVNQTIEMNN